MHLLPKTPTADGRAQRTAAENMFRKLIVEYHVEMINVSSMCVTSAAAALLLCDAMNVFYAAAGCQTGRTSKMQSFLVL